MSLSMILSPDYSSQRDRNLALFLRYLRELAPLSRAQMAELMNVNRSTVSNLTDELISRGLVYEVGLENSSSGRPGRLLAINPAAGFVVGCELGLTYIRVALTDFGGQVRWHTETPLQLADGQDAVVQTAVALIRQAVGHCSGRMLGVGVTLPGWVDQQQELLISAPNLQWRDVPIGALLRKQIEWPLTIDNDANAAALGEHLYGRAKGKRDFLFLRAGTGIGGGLFLNGDLYRGAGGLAGEIGHVSLNRHDNRPCRCGKRGCWEMEANSTAVISRVRQHLDIGRESMLSEQLPLTFEQVVEAADRGDAVALEALAETGLVLGYGLGNLINIFNPELIVLGGAMGSAFTHLQETMKEGVTTTVLPQLAERVAIEATAFGAEAIVIGAAALAVEAVLARPKQVSINEQ